MFREDSSSPEAVKSSRKIFFTKRTDFFAGEKQLVPIDNIAPVTFDSRFFRFIQRAGLSKMFFYPRFRRFPEGEKNKAFVCINGNRSRVVFRVQFRG